VRKWVEIRRHNGRKKLFVDGTPFLVLGVQFNYNNSGKVSGFDYLFKHAARLGCNTVFWGLTWKHLEGVPGRYDWSKLDHAIRRCRQYGLRMSLLWFGTKQGDACWVAPDWMQADKDRFPRIRNAEGVELNGLCWNNPELQALEKKAFDATLRHLSRVDGKRHTVILLQVQNEPCWEMYIVKKGRFREMDQWVERCHCDRCNAEKGRTGGTDHEFGVRAAVRHMNTLLKDQKRLFPVLTYVNFAINPIRPGGDVDIFLDECRRLDFVAPDFYGYQQGDLGFTMRFFARGRNLPFMAECATEKVGDSDRNLWLCIMEHGSQGFDPWALDHAFGWRIVRDNVVEHPPVSREGRWSDMAVKFSRAQRPLRAADRQIACALGSENIMHYVSQGVPLRLEERRWGLFWRFENGPDARWAVVRSGRDDLTVTGTDCLVSFFAMDPARKLGVEEGRWEGNRWISTRKMAARVLMSNFRRQGLDDRAPTWDLDLDEGRTFRIRIHEK